MERADRFVTVDGTEIHYAEWGPSDAPAVVCVHGLSRVGRDFDPIARALAGEYRVLCPDVPGRGLSEWATIPEAEYTRDALVSTLVGFCDALGLDSLRWIGTSMGGSLGILAAGGPLRDRISHLVVNDVGPGPADGEDAEGVDRIVEYLTNPPRFDAVSGLEDYYRDVYEPFSPMTDAEWRRFAITSARRRDDGTVTPSYDTRVVEPLLARPPERDPWAAWDDIRADLFVLRGTDSDILSAAAFEEMLARQPGTETLEVDCGHAPQLNVAAQIEPIEAFLAG